MSNQLVIPREKTVSFILPGLGRVPTGGFRVVYEYANELTKRGWHVRVIHPYDLNLEEIEETRKSFLRRGRKWLGYHRHKIIGTYRPDAWFEIDPRVELLCTRNLNGRYLSPSDVWVATFWYTAKWVATYAGARAYLIQHLETFAGPESDVLATWKLPLRKVVISRWLEDVARSLGESADYIPNGLNFRVFGRDVPSELRHVYAAMLYHKSDWKGSADGLRALFAVKAKVPRLKALIFGVSPAPADIPDWIEYYQNPPQERLREIYNRAAVFLSPSWAEGWPLPPAEALQCGAALAATNIGGHREYAIQGETALLSPPKDPDAMAANVVHLLGNQELRVRLAHQGHAHIQQFTWSRAVMGFESVLEKALRDQNALGSVPSV